MTKHVEALVGMYDTGRLIALGEEVRGRGGFAGDLDTVVEQVVQQKPTNVILCGELLSVCVSIATEKLLDWREDGDRIREVRVDLRNCRSSGSPANENESGGFEPNQQQLELRRLALVSRLSERHKNDPRLIIDPPLADSSGTLS
ncbi:hypothetical protein ACFL2C_00240 [Patescibacteria group bacterium]